MLSEFNYPWFMRKFLICCIIKILGIALMHAYENYLTVKHSNTAIHYAKSSLIINWLKSTLTIFIYANIWPMWQFLILFRKSLPSWSAYMWAPFREIFKYVLLLNEPHFCWHATECSHHQIISICLLLVICHH